MTEEYRQVEEFDNYYVSNYGNIKNKRSGILLSRHDCRGVLRVNLCKYVIHIDKNRHKNNVINLQWTSIEDWTKNNHVASVLSTLENRNST